MTLIEPGPDPVSDAGPTISPKARRARQSTVVCPNTECGHTIVVTKRDSQTLTRAEQAEQDAARAAAHEMRQDLTVEWLYADPARQGQVLV